MAHLSILSSRDDGSAFTVHHALPPPVDEARERLELLERPGLEEAVASEPLAVLRPEPSPELEKRLETFEAVLGQRGLLTCDERSKKEQPRGEAKRRGEAGAHGRGSDTRKGSSPLSVVDFFLCTGSSPFMV